MVSAVYLEHSAKSVLLYMHSWILECAGIEICLIDIFRCTKSIWKYCMQVFNVGRKIAWCWCIELQLCSLIIFETPFPFSSSSCLYRDAVYITPGSSYCSEGGDNTWDAGFIFHSDAGCKSLLFPNTILSWEPMREMESKRGGSVGGLV